MIFKVKFLKSTELELTIRIICYITEIIGANHKSSFPTFKMETVQTEHISPHICTPNLNETVFRSAARFVSVVRRKTFSEQSSLFVGYCAGYRTPPHFVLVYKFTCSICH